MLDTGSTDIACREDRAATWADATHRASPVLPAELAAVRQARAFAREELAAVGLPGCADDAGLLVSELAANAVLHARTPFTVHLRPTLEGGVRVEIEDGSALPPVLTTASSSATSGRGLDLVASMALRWGSHPVPGGKVVWFEVEADGAVAPPVADTAELLALWGTEELVPGKTRTQGLITSALSTAGPTHEVVVADLPVAELLAAKEAMDDLLRELQLLLLLDSPLDAASAVSERSGGPDADVERRHERAVADRLDAAARAFDPARRQVREQVSRAAAQGEALVTLRLWLPATAAQDAAEYRHALEAAEEHSRDGSLLTLPEGLDSHSALRRRYLDEVIRQLPRR